LVAYILIVIALFFIHAALLHFWSSRIFSFITGSILLCIYLWFIGNVERKELPQLPFIGRYFK
jgi:hypothetical protein